MKGCAQALRLPRDLRSDVSRGAGAGDAGTAARGDCAAQRQGVLMVETTADAVGAAVVSKYLEVKVEGLL